MEQAHDVLEQPVDLVKLRQRFDEDDELLAEIFEVFVAEAPQRRSGIEGALAVGDMGQLTRLSHALKGVAATMFAEELRQVAYALEVAARDGEKERATGLVPRVLQQLERTSAYLDSLI